MEDTDNIPEVYERQKLYQEVWAEPVKIVARRYGVSDVALAKTCRKLAIPLPGRGHWAQLRAGQKMKRIPLARLPAGVPETLPVYHAFPPPEEREASPETAARMEKESDAEAAIVVTDALERPHPLVRAASKYFHMRNPPPIGHLDLSVSKDSLDRALRIMDALIKALVARGPPVEVTERKVQASGYYQYAERTEDSNVTRVRVDGEWVTFGMEERSKVVIPDPPEPPKHLKGEKLESWIYWNQPRRSLVPNGVLVLKLKNVSYPRVRAECKDGARTKLEDQLNDVVAHIYLAGEALKEKRRQDEQAALAQAERHKREHEEYLRRQEQERKAKVLSGWMEGWRLARDIRAFVAEALSSRADPEGMLAWALQYADSVDPLQKLRESQAEEDEQDEDND
ncbi:MAG: hypothetical protein A2133_12385 [Actinobacteria bacterium RBG_16_64_13]|nr:MAG: hypothetical protein A2133_12385 [Actinobacteria bacterium RBG_16_64_13]